MYLVTSLHPTSQTLDSVALAAFASQYRASIGTELQTAIDQHKAQAVVVETGADILTAATTLTRDSKGKTFFLDSATEFAVTLPSPEPGLTFEFVVKSAPSGADYTIVTASSANIIKGKVLSADLNAASDGDIETTGGDTISFVSAKAVAGDRAILRCDGTNWFADITTTVFDAATITTAT